MGAWDVFVAVGTVLSFVAAIIEIVRGRKAQSLALLSLVGALGIATVLLLVDNAETEAQNRALTDVQARAGSLIDSWETTGGGFDIRWNSVGENRGVVVAAADFLLDFRDCRPEAYDRLDRVFTDAQAEAEGLPDYDTSLPQDASTIWAHAAETAYEQVHAISRVSPNCR